MDRGLCVVNVLVIGYNERAGNNDEEKNKNYLSG
jgi:hypothetical protein